MKVNVKQMTVDTSVIQREEDEGSGSGCGDGEVGGAPVGTSDDSGSEPSPNSNNQGIAGLEELFEQYELRKRY